MYIILFALIALSAVRVLPAGPERSRTLQMLAGLRPRHFAKGLLALAGVLAAIVVLAQIPGLHVGGHMLLNQAGDQAADGSNLAVAGIQRLPLLAGLALSVVLLAVLPGAAHNEELAFRRFAVVDALADTLGAARPARRWPWWVTAGPVFGLLHLIMAIPLYAALALSVAGLVFAADARRHARRAFEPVAEFYQGIHSEVGPSMVARISRATDRWHKDGRAGARSFTQDHGGVTDPAAVGLAEAARTHLAYNLMIVAVMVTTLLGG